MDALISLFTDFEKKFLALLGDLLFKPKAVLSEVMKKEKKYAAPFRIYSYVVSLCILLILILNFTGDGLFELENKRIPLFWENYIKSRNDFIMTMIPILGFIEVILIFSVLTFIFFRKPSASLWHHLKYNTYVISLIGIYYVLAAASLNVAGHYYNVANDVWIMRGILVIIPSLLFLNTFRAFQNRWYWIMLKGIPVILVGVLIMVRIFFIGNFNERLHSFMVYWKYNKHEVNPTQRSSSISLTADNWHFKDLIVESRDAFSGIALASLDTAVLMRSNLMGEIEFSQKIPLSGDNFNSSKYIAAAEIPHAGKPNYLFFMESSAANQKDPAVDIYHLSNNRTTLLGSLDSLSSNSICRVRRDKIYFSFYHEKTRLPAFMDMDTLLGRKHISFLNGMEKWVIGDFYLDGVGDSALILAHHENEKRSLSQVALVKAVLTDSGTQILDKSVLYDNPYSDRSNHRIGSLSKTKISRERLLEGSDSGTFIASYRIFTDKSFAMKITSFDRANLHQRWSRDINLPYDLVFFDDMVVKDHSIIVAGRAYQVITGNFLEKPYYRPFIIKLDEHTGETIDFGVLEQSYSVENFEASLITNPSKVFFDGSRIILFHYFEDVLRRTEVSFKKHAVEKVTLKN